MPDGSWFNPASELARRDATLIDNGYEPVAVLGKAALGPAWSARPNTIAAIVAERAALPDAISTGLRTGALVGLDIDILDSAHAARMWELAIDVLEYTPLERVGAKGMMLCYRNETPIKKITIGKAKDGKVEILGLGQQFVAYGIHPDTGKPYERRDELCAGAEPLIVPLADLPPVTREQLIAFAHKAAALLSEIGYGPAHSSISGEEKPADPEASSAGADGRVSWEGLRRRLSYIHPAFDGTRPSCYPAPSRKRQERPLDYSPGAWLGIGLALRDANIPLLDDEPHDWLNLADEWSCGALWYERTSERLADLNYPPEGVRKRLAGHTRRDGGDPKTTIATIIAYAIDAGCPLPPNDEPVEMVANAFGGGLSASEPRGDNPRPGVLQLDRKTPYASAAHFLRRHYTEPDGTSRLIHYREDFYAWTGTHYRSLPEAQLRAEIYPFLDAAFQGNKPFAPNATKVQ
jgi:hypothetical protein